MFNVSIKTVQRIINEVCEFDGINAEDLEFYTDVQFNGKYIVRAYEPESDRTLFIVIDYNYNTKRYVYDLKVCDGDKPEQYKSMSV